MTGRPSSAAMAGRFSACMTRGLQRGRMALNIKSVVVFGHVEFVEDWDKMRQIARVLSYKFADDAEYIEHEIQSVGPGTMVFTLVPDHMTGKLGNES